MDCSLLKFLLDQLVPVQFGLKNQNGRGTRKWSQAVRIRKARATCTLTHQTGVPLNRARKAAPSLTLHLGPRGPSTAIRTVLRLFKARNKPFVSPTLRRLLEPRIEAIPKRSSTLTCRSPSELRLTGATQSRSGRIRRRGNC